MGGYGAFKLALNHPDRFAAAASLSGALDIRSRTLADAGRKFDLILGGKDPQGTSADLFHLIDKHKNNPNRPLLYQSCGTEDFLYEDNQRFTAHCQKLSQLPYSPATKLPPPFLLSLQSHGSRYSRWNPH